MDAKTVRQIGLGLSLWAAFIAFLAFRPVQVPAHGVLLEEPSCAPASGLPVYKIQTVHPGGTASASAVVYAPGRLLTAAHALPPETSQVMVHFPSGPREATVLAQDAVDDLAVLEADTGSAEPVAIATRSLPAGEPVWAAGYPGSSDSLLSFAGVVLHDQGRVYTATAPAWPGISGGPLLSCDGDTMEISGIVIQYSMNLMGMTIERTGDQILREERYANSGLSKSADQRKIERVLEAYLP